LGGNSLDNLINGGDGNDTIQVSEGKKINFILGNDHLDGGNGNNTLNCSILEAPIRISSKSLPGY
jgi:Ca2+-binding RTX toxin-like protein